MSTVRIRLVVVITPLIAIATGILAVFWVLRPEREPPIPTDAASWLSELTEISDEGFERPSAEWELRLPEDHGAHTNTRTENWHITAHLRNGRGEDLGFQFSLLRLGVAPPDAPPPTSIWDLRQLYLGYVTFLGSSRDRAHGEERFGRGIPELAGYDPDTRELRFDSWSVRFGTGETGDRMTLNATVGNEAVVRLVLAPEKPSVALEPDGDGVPVVGYSMTRLAVEGTVERGSDEEPVTGTAWFDHLWGELPLPGAGPVTWNRLQLQLEDGSDIAVIQSRRSDGKGIPTVTGLTIEPDGAVTRMDDETLRMTSARTWRRPGTDIAYPVEWTLFGPGLELSVEPLSDSQAHDFATPLWSGVIRAEGRHAGKTVSGIGTMQLTGYASR